ncbi:MAG: ribonuclease III [Armatimonadetes bacterium]|nr:ribonuclease III [Armatimonadota bacterium]
MTHDPRAAFEERLGVRFGDPELLAQALRHPSYTREREADRLESNERLEFLGDAVVQLAVSGHLHATLTDQSEGGLTSIRSFVVRGTSLAAAAGRVGLGEVMQLGAAAAGASLRGRRSILAAGLEAVLGAVYLDQGWDTARECVLRLLEQQIADASSRRHRNAKGELQELTQGRWRQTPAYRLLFSGGPPHQREFEVEVTVGGRVLGRGRAGSKKDAEQAAAAEALAELAAGGNQSAPGGL